MSDRAASTTRTVLDAALAMLLTADCGALVCVGVLQWVLTVLQSIYPCGEGYLVHPRCVLAHPERIDLAYALLVAAPALCGARGIVGIALRIAQRRHFVLQSAVAFVIALGCSLVGSRMLDATLADRIPWP